MIELRKVTKFFGRRIAVDELTLQVPPGEIFGLLGHNGAGKSTAIGMMLGQVWPSAGEVIICGADVSQNRKQALAGVGAIFETPAFYDYLSGWENLKILSHYTAPTSDRRIAEVLDWVGLTGREQSKVRTYSHGMRARLALAQALLPAPKLLILDEPGEGLDPSGITEMRQMVLRLQKELGLTILLSSHLLSEVEQICTRIAVLQTGKLVFEGPLAQTKGGGNWYRLKVDDFSRAVALLQSAGWLCGSEDGCRVALQEGLGSDRVVRLLVESGISVYEIARREHTLEDFYLSLVRQHETRTAVSSKS